MRKKSARSIEKKEGGAVTGHMNNELGKLEGHALRREHHRY